MLARTPIPARAVRFSPTGRHVAVAGGEPATIRLVQVADNTHVQVLRPAVDDDAYSSVVENAVVALEFDALGELMATVHEQRAWPPTGGAKAGGKAAAPNVCLWSVDTQRPLAYGVGGVQGACAVRASPDGAYWAIGDAAGKVQVLQRGAWHDAPRYTFDVAAVVAGSERSGHGASTPAVRVHALAWDVHSAARLVAAVGDERGEIGGALVLCDLPSARTTLITETDAAVLDIEWSPEIRTVFYVDLLGQLGAAAVAPALNNTHWNRPGDLAAPAAADAPNDGAPHRRAPGESSSGASCTGDNHPASHGDGSTAASSPASDDERSEQSVTDVPAIRSSHRHRHSASTGLRAPFQPGASLDLHLKRRILQWNLIGCITSSVHEAGEAGAPPGRQIDIEFTDASRRSVRFFDRRTFTVAALGEHAACFAAAGERGAVPAPACLFYRPHESWTSSGEWTRHLDDHEQPLAVAVGKLWVAVATSAQQVRLFSFTGLPTEAFCPRSAGSLLTICAADDRLCVVTQVPHGGSMGAYEVYQVNERGEVEACLASGWLPAPASSTGVDEGDEALGGDNAGGAEALMWIGFGDTPTRASATTPDGPQAFTDWTEPRPLLVYDTAGRMCMLRRWDYGRYGGGVATTSSVWQGVAHRGSLARALARSDPDCRWDTAREWMCPLGVRDEALFGVLLSNEERWPAAYPRPRIHRVALPQGMAAGMHGDEGVAAEMERECLQLTAAVRGISAYLAGAAMSGARPDTAQHRECAAARHRLRLWKRRLDKLLLRMMEEACRHDRDSRVMDLAARLSNRGAFTFAVQIANHFKKAILADRMTKLAEAKWPAAATDASAERAEEKPAPTADPVSPVATNGDDLSSTEFNEDTPTAPSRLASRRVQGVPAVRARALGQPAASSPKRARRFALDALTSTDRNRHDKPPSDPLATLARLSR
ncbi:hypothetical protein CDCA_CDCA13G3643 [Cyanidium caldarium]|uniref:Minichromosome loss protein Mcl1 middle region domain-containing protein n=1 Tax=Cyanidium caldarium TaxID=2771 RepID=A0AAV9J0R7_CYACA|nr:hypothetical protein CDCA_CDCA13G3643 [Cyanidium caldarium]